jgi:similar to stage IV sporulation protein
MLLLGLLAGIFFLFGLSQFVWEIEVSGNTSYTKEDIVKYIEREAVPLGTLKIKVNCSDLEEQLRIQYEEIAWVSCSLEGCRLSVDMKETLDKNSKNNAADPCDLVASKAGVVTSIVTQNGTPLVEKGQKVKKGDTLITGNIYIFSDSNEVLETHQIIAEGEIKAKTKVSYESSFSLDYYKKEYSGKQSYTYALYFCKKRIPLMPQIQQKDGMDQVAETYPFKIGKTFYLPIALEKTVTKRYKPVKKTYGKQEAYQLAQKKIKKKIRELEEKGVNVLDQNIEIQVKDNKCEAKGYFILEESIGKIRAIKKLTEEQEKQITPTESVN